MSRLTESLFETAKNIAKDPVKTWAIGTMTATGIMYLAAKADLKNQEKYYECELRKQKAISGIGGSVSRLQDIVYGVVLESKNKEITELEVKNVELELEINKLKTKAE